MEASAANLARVQNNAEMINDKNYTDFLRVKGNEREYYPDTILMGEIRHCRRCLSIWPDIVELTKHYPSIQFGILVLEKPMWDLKKRLFDKDAVLARNRGLVVPMFLFYKSGEFKEIIATKREEHPPAINSILQSIAKHFSISDA